MRTHNKPFHNSGFYFIVLLVLAVIGFWQSYFSKLFGDIDSYIHFHAISMLLWVGMLITQSFLIRFKKRSLHRFIGKLSYGLVPVLIISLILLAHSRIVIGEDGILPTRLYTFTPYCSWFIFLFMFTLLFCENTTFKNQDDYAIVNVTEHCEDRSDS